MSRTEEGGRRELVSHGHDGWPYMPFESGNQIARQNDPSNLRTPITRNLHFPSAIHSRKVNGVRLERPSGMAFHDQIRPHNDRVKLTEGTFLDVRWRLPMMPRSLGALGRNKKESLSGENREKGLRSLFPKHLRHDREDCHEYSE